MEQRAAPEPRDDRADPTKANIAAVARLERATTRELEALLKDTDVGALSAKVEGVLEDA